MDVTEQLFFFYWEFHGLYKFVLHVELSAVHKTKEKINEYFFKKIAEKRKIFAKA